jgi:Fuc2NAc and GlcNAc transferase
VNIALLLAVVSCGTSMMVTGGVRAYALRRDILDRPNTRSSHSTATPRGGGLAIVSVALTFMAAGVNFEVIQERDALTLGLGLLVLGTAGWADDRRGLRPSARLAVQLGVACWTVFMLGGLPAVRVGASSVAFGPVGYVLASLGIVWSINLFNFMDGIDGLAGSQAVLIFGTGAVLLCLRGNQSLGSIAGVLAGASAGFLAWNWPPAKIFMGDAGSGALGYAIAGLALSSESEHSVPLVAFGIMGGVFIADATVTLLRRLHRGERLTVAHRNHAYQRLSRAWESHRSVSLAAGSVTALLALLAAAGTMEARLLVPALSISFILLTSVLFAIERRAPMK